MEGKNIADFVDPDILEKLMALEAEEEAALAAEEGAWTIHAIEPVSHRQSHPRLPQLTALPHSPPSPSLPPAAAAAANPPESDEDEETATLHKAIVDKKKMMLTAHRREKAKNSNRAVVPRTVIAAKRPSEEVRAHLTGLGLPAEAAERVLEGRKRGRSATRRARDEEGGDEEDGGMEVEEGGERDAKKARGRSKSRALAASSAGIPMDYESTKARKRSASRVASQRPAAKQGLKDEVQAGKIRKAIKKMQAKKFMGIQGESDRIIPAQKPKHLFSGTAGIGKVSNAAGATEQTAQRVDVWRAGFPVIMTQSPHSLPRRATSPSYDITFQFAARLALKGSSYPWP